MEELGAGTRVPLGATPHSPRELSSEALRLHTPPPRGPPGPPSPSPALGLSGAWEAQGWAEGVALPPGTLSLFLSYQTGR